MSDTRLSPPPSRDEGPTLSDVLPFRSRSISLIRSRALIPLLVTGIVCVILFQLRPTTGANAQLFTYLGIVTILLLYIMFMGLYVYSGERKLSLWYIVPAVATYYHLRYGFDPYVYVFRKLLPGNIGSSSFATSFVDNFFGAGLCEELLKSAPALVALLIAWLLRATGTSGGFVGRLVRLEGPIDGLLMGVAAAAGFIFLETVQEYVPNEIRRVTGGIGGTVALGALKGVLLMLPRVLNGVIGHMAWAGIFGYFIGLAVSHRRSALSLVLFGWLVAAVLHAFWNSNWWLLGDYGEYVSAVITLFVFLSCLVKGKQLEVSRLGGPIDGRSILMVYPPAALAGAGPAGIVPPRPAGIGGILTGTVTGLERLIGVKAHTTLPNPGGVVAPLAPIQHGLSIGAGATRYALAPDREIDASSLFASAGIPAGCRARIIARPDGGLDLQNVGSETWGTAAPDGSARSVPPGATLPASAGTRLQLGAATVDIQAY